MKNDIIDVLLSGVSLRELKKAVEEEVNINCRTFNNYTILALTVIYYNNQGYIMWFIILKSLLYNIFICNF